MRLTTVVTSYRSFLTAAIAATGLSLLTTVPALAANFKFQDSPSAQVVDSAASLDINNNTRSVNNLGVQNIGNAGVQAAFVLPFLWTAVDGNIIALEWENQRNGWFTDDYNTQGDDLLVQLSSITDRVRLGDIANITGTSPYPVTQPCNNDPSCITFAFPLPPLTQDADDEIPFLDLGTFGLNETKLFDLDFEFDFEDNRAGTLQLGVGAFTAGPVGEEVPEPGSIMAIVAVGALALKLKQKRD